MDLIDDAAHIPPLKAKQGRDGKKPLDPVGARNERGCVTATDIVYKPVETDTEVELEK
jgi:hypothetical protein